MTISISIKGIEHSGPDDRGAVREPELQGPCYKKLVHIIFRFPEPQWKFVVTSGADPGEVKWVNFPPPPLFSEPPSFFFFLIPQILTSNTSSRLWFYYIIITKINPPFQNPGSAPGHV